MLNGTSNACFFQLVKKSKYRILVTFLSPEPKPKDTLLQATGITKKYGELQVLRGVDLTVHAGETVALVGSSGAGKTTLLNILGTLDVPDSGEIKVDGQPILKWDDHSLARFRNQSIGFVFQFHNLMAEFNVLENVLMPAWIGGKNDHDTVERAEMLVTQLGISERMRHKPSQLSGGEQQRVAVARALMNQPRILLADEPTGNLDSKNAEVVVELLMEAARANDVCCLLVTHNNHLAQKAHRIVHIHNGLIDK